jgi:sugar phosphate isomerase/epimerase
MDKRIGAQYYTIREHTKTVEDFDASCKKIAEIGYKLVQISGTPLAAADMRPILDKYGLQCVTTHKGFNDFLTDIDGVIEYNKTLGCDLCGVGMMPESYFADGESVTKFIEECKGICAKLKEAGMYFGYHNHSFEFIKYDGKTIYDRLIEETDPEVFNFIVDTYWVQVGGKNPAEHIERLGKRAMAIHFKDLCIEKGSWTTPKMSHVGVGSLDWDGIIAACEKAGCRWALVEQDGNHIDGDPFKALALSYNYLTTKGFC